MNIQLLLRPFRIRGLMLLAAFTDPHSTMLVLLVLRGRRMLCVFGPAVFKAALALALLRRLRIPLIRGPPISGSLKVLLAVTTALLLVPL